MLISEVKTAFKIADVKYNNSTKLDFVYLKNLVDQEKKLCLKISSLKIIQEFILL